MLDATMDKKIIFVIHPHSIVDVITNSSTELFVIDEDKTVEVVREIIKEKEKEFLPEYGCYTSINLLDDWRIPEVFGYVDEEEAVNFLRAKGYKVEKEITLSPKKYIEITAERGGIHPKLVDFINKTFTVIFHDTEQ